MHRYVIEGNVITREDITSTRMVTLDGLLPNLTSYIPVELAPLPRDCRYLLVKPRDNMGLSAKVIVEHQPMLQRINHKNASARQRMEAVNYRIMLPYGLFWFNLHGNRMVTPQGENIIWTPQHWGYLWSNNPFTTTTGSQVWAAKLPNCWDNGTVCFGSTNVAANQQLGHFIDAAVNTFWTSEFNQDLHVRYPYPSLREWEEASSANPDAWRSWDVWQNDSRSVKDTLAQVDDMNWNDPVPSSTDTPIQPLRIQPTFWNLREWLADMSAADQQRLRDALANG